MSIAAEKHLINKQGTCPNCNDSNAIEVSVRCLFCKSDFHAVCRDVTNVQMSENICTQSFYRMFSTVTVKAGVNASRPGNFKFVCNPCIAQFDQNDVGINTDNLDQNLENKVSSPESIDMVDFNILLSEKLLSFKSEILSTIDNKLDTVLTNLPKNDLHQQNNNLVTTTEPMYSEVTKVTQPMPTSNIANGTTVLRSDTKNASGEPNHVLILSTEYPDQDYTTVQNSISQLLSKTPVQFCRTKKSTKKIAIGFPSADHKSSAKLSLSKCPVIQAQGFSITEPKKMSPKITITNIPSYVFSHINRNLPIPEYRSEAKSTLRDLILSKNEQIAKLVSDEHIFEPVYINVGKDYTTAGIKVTIAIRDLLIDSGKIYIANTACNVFDRFHHKQCFKCQKVGHISSSCSETISICMYCSASHKTVNCPVKDKPKQYRCRNCSRSKDSTIASQCNTHHAGSNECPTIKREKLRLARNTASSALNLN